MIDKKDEIENQEPVEPEMTEEEKIRKDKGRDQITAAFVFFIFGYFIFTAVDLGYKSDVLDVPNITFTLNWIGLFVGLAVSIIWVVYLVTGSGFAGRIGYFALTVFLIFTVVTFVMKPDWTQLAADSGLEHGVPGVLNSYDKYI